MHELARAGKIRPEEVEKRPVTVYSLKVSEFDAIPGAFDLDVRCSGGTYVRTLITDIGREVGSAAHMTELERTRHGPFCTEADAARAAEEGLAAAGVRPVTVEEIHDAPRLLEALQEAGEALATMDPDASAD